MAKKWLLVLDIDDTQIPDRNKGTYAAGEYDVVRELREQLNQLSGKDVIVAHVTNGIFEDYLKVRDQLAEPDYISCAASTQIFKKEGDRFVLDEDHQAKIRQAHFDPAKALAAGSAVPELAALGPEHQSDVKVSFQFKDDVGPEERARVYNALRDSYAGEPGTSVLYVESDKEYYIDLLPQPCVKGENVMEIAHREGISPENIVAIGNGNNDVSLLRGDFRTAAVENAAEILKDHVRTLASNSGTPERHIIANGIRAAGVLDALRQFGLIPQPAI